MAAFLHVIVVRHPMTITLSVRNRCKVKESRRNYKPEPPRHLHDFFCRYDAVVHAVVPAGQLLGLLLDLGRTKGRQGGTWCEQEPHICAAAAIFLGTHLPYFNVRRRFVHLLPTTTTRHDVHMTSKACATDAALQRPSSATSLSLCMMLGVLIHVSSGVGWMRGEELGDARTVAERFDHGVKSTA